MSLFQSEEHARNWSLFDPVAAGNLKPLSDYLERFSGRRFRARGRTDYVSWVAAQQESAPAKAEREQLRCL